MAKPKKIHREVTIVKNVEYLGTLTEWQTAINAAIKLYGGAANVDMNHWDDYGATMVELTVYADVMETQKEADDRVAQAKQRLESRRGTYERLKKEFGDA